VAIKVAIKETENKIKVFEKEAIPLASTIELANNAHIAAKTGLTAAKKKAQENAVIKII